MKSSNILYLFKIIRHHLILWLVLVFLIPVVFYGAMILAPMIKFQQIPNYVRLYDWWANVQLIIQSTPSVRDQAFIIKDEWLVEIGYMNYDFGIGISQWSLFIAPIKVLGVFAMSLLLATWLVLCKGITSSCSRQPSWINLASGGVGGAMIALASVSLSWVVCCSTPTWVVGLAMMGVGVTTALWLEPLGVWVSVIGFVLLAITLFSTAYRIDRHAHQHHEYKELRKGK